MKELGKEKSDGIEDNTVISFWKTESKGSLGTNPCLRKDHAPIRVLRHIILLDAAFPIKIRASMSHAVGDNRQILIDSFGCAVSYP